MAIVTLYDIEEKLVTDWARSNCPSFTSWSVYENDQLVWADNDRTWTWKTRYEFDLVDEQEALIFRLKWQGQ